MVLVQSYNIYKNGNVTFAKKKKRKEKYTNAHLYVHTNGKRGE